MPQKFIFFFLFPLFLFNCNFNYFSSVPYKDDKQRKVFQSLIDRFSDISVNETISSPIQYKIFSINDIGVDDIKKLDNIVLSKDSLLNSLPEPKIKLTDNFKENDIKVSIIKDSVIRDKIKNSFSYKVLLEQNEIFKELLIQYEL